ncbi:hypothetical protein COO60DRAFT_1510061, partial [Scenedesmus sp. NREL 46B-D3]
IVGMADESDGCLSSSINSTDTLTIIAKSPHNGEEEFVGNSAACGVAAAVAPAEPANRTAGTATDTFVQLLAAYGYSSRVVKLQNPAAAAAAAAAAVGGARVRGGHSSAPSGDDGRASRSLGKSHGVKRAFWPVGGAGDERVCCGYADLTTGPGCKVAGLGCDSGGTIGNAKTQACDLAAAIAHIRDAVMSAGVAAAVPVAGGGKVLGRKVVRLTAASGLVRGCAQYGSALAA